MRNAFAVTFGVYKPPDIVHLHETFKILELLPPDDLRVYPLESIQPDGRLKKGEIFHLREGIYLWHFFKEYGHKYQRYVSPLDNDDEYVESSTAGGSHQASEGIISAKWIPYWLWTVTVEIIKIYLEGFCRADGSFKKTPAGKQGMPIVFASSRLFSCHFCPKTNQI